MKDREMNPLAKPRELSVGTVKLVRLHSAEAFRCTRCGVEKTSKLRGVWVQRDGSTMAICNGCYGSLIAAYGRP